MIMCGKKLVVILFLIASRGTAIASAASFTTTTLSPANNAILSNTLAHRHYYLKNVHQKSPSRVVQLFGTVRPDVTEAIADALQMSEKYGATSKEARVAWDIVEEMDSNDSSSAFNTGNSSPISTTQDYYDHIRSLSYILKETNSKMNQMKTLIKKVQELELADPSLAKLPDDTSDGAGAALKAALANAKAAAEVYGPSSAEVREAWDKLDSCFGQNENGVWELSDECQLEEMSSPARYSAAALKAHHYYDAAIDTALLQEALDALSVIEGLGNFVGLEKRRLDARNN